ncbi:MAG: hypothetical protein KatS3mg017_0854 [Fimbriimonadales bacterium]|nr:MAG: hypothetical protein KatS3mg017_0854 [Fimbriimonadales bacterium]
MRRPPVEAVITEAIEYILNTQGVLLVPAFAVGRVQLLLHHLRRLQERRTHSAPARLCGQPYGAGRDPALLSFLRTT